ncbi:MAG TPA: uroporphyrinogen decarboxylase family protein [Candidatus Lokiarchaeia archaeon]|nr:uroporphyrinogen decarboxylase family protein [Candidatus Lokiarchaeia archaeon]
MTQSKRQIVIDAIHHVSTPVLPYDVSFTRNLAERLKKDFKARHQSLNIGRFITSVGDGGSIQLPDHRRQDHFGVIWRMDRKGDIGVVDNCLIKAPDLDAYQFPMPRKTSIEWSCRYLTRWQTRNLFRMFSIGFSLFERAWTLRGGIQNFLADLIRYPDFSHALLDKICEYNLGVLDIVLKHASKIDAIYFGDDWGMQRGTLMGLRHWRTFIKPRLARMYKRVKDAGLFVCQHSCGDINELFPDLIEIGLDIYNTFQPEAYDLEAVKRDYGDKLTFFGGISTQTLLPFGTPETIRAEVKRIMLIMGANGGYIVAPTHVLTEDIPTDNIKAFLDVIQNQ